MRPHEAATLESRLKTNTSYNLSSNFCGDSDPFQKGKAQVLAGSKALMKTNHRQQHRI